MKTMSEFNHFAEMAMRKFQRGRITSKFIAVKGNGVGIFKTMLSVLVFLIVADVDAQTTDNAPRNQEIGLKLDKPVKVLYLGDSLTDYDRGSNHVDKVQAKIEKIAPGMVKFYNYSVRGDFITRVLARFNRIKGVYGPERFDGIWDCQYDWAFVFLGHNDTRASSETNFQKPLVEVEKIAVSYGKLISILRSKGIKRIVIVSPSSSNFELTSSKAEKIVAAIKAGKAGKRKHTVRFGDPKHMEAFRDIVRKFALQNGCEFFDIYDDMKVLPNKAELFRSTDGVHLTQKGHEYIADRTYNYLLENGTK
jgi:lysophospholipase L1-like esterase